MLHIPIAVPKSDLARSRIYRCLYDHRGFCTRQMLANECEISLPTLYQNLTELIGDGLVRYSGEEQSTGGRRAQGLEIVPDVRFAVGIGLMENRVRIAAADLRLNVLRYQEVPLEGILRRPEAAGELWRTFEHFLDQSGLPRERLLGVGIAIPGIVSAGRDRVIMAPTLHLKDAPLDGLIQGVPYPVNIENDASSSGYAEWFVRGESQNMAYLSLESGVGGAVLIGGTPYSGDNSRSGEFGHLCVEPGGLTCHCGQHGCLEAYCSTRRITEGMGLTLNDFFRAVERHEPACEALWFDMLRHLAIGINSIYLALDCRVILGGLLSEYLGPWLSELKRYVCAGNPFGEADFVNLSTLRRHIAPLGGALHFIREFIYSV